MLPDLCYLIERSLDYRLDVGNEDGNSIRNPLGVSPGRLLHPHSLRSYIRGRTGNFSGRRFRCLLCAASAAKSGVGRILMTASTTEHKLSPCQAERCQPALT